MSDFEKLKVEEFLQEYTQLVEKHNIEIGCSCESGYLIAEHIEGKFSFGVAFNSTAKHVKKWRILKECDYKAGDKVRVGFDAEIVSIDDEEPAVKVKMINSPGGEVSFKYIPSKYVNKI